MLQSLISFDLRLFLFINSHHSAFFDLLMWQFSNKLFWSPLYVWFLWELYKKFPKKYWTVLIAVVLMIVVSDQLSNLVKNSVMRLRPSHEMHLFGQVHVVNNYRGGDFGFYSAHASNAFAVAMFLILSLGGKPKHLICAIAIIYASLTAYSRIYLGVHYPSDVATGMMIGCLLGIGTAVLHQWARDKYLLVKDQ